MLRILIAMKYVQRSKYTALRSITINSINFTSKNDLEENIYSRPKSVKADTTWIPMYSFPHITVASLLNRLKLFQTTFTIAVVPLSIIMKNYGLMDMTGVKICAGTALFATSTLFIVTSFLGKLIGIMYVTDDKQSVKISHLTFWGERKDIVVPTEDIVPLTDYECKPSDLYVKVRRYSTNEVLYLTLLYGKIKDKDKFQSVFGDIYSIGTRK